MYTYIYVCMYVCMYIHTCIYIHIYIHTPHFHRFHFRADALRACARSLACSPTSSTLTSSNGCTRLATPPRCRHQTFGQSGRKACRTRDWYECC